MGKFLLKHMYPLEIQFIILRAFISMQEGKCYIRVKVKEYLGRKLNWFYYKMCIQKSIKGYREFEYS